MLLKQNLTIRNYSAGRDGKNIQYIVIHNTANNGDTALGNANYFHSEYRKASAHYFVDEDNVVQVVKDTDTAWHCADKQKAVAGGGAFKGKCTNSNSIGIEHCTDLINGELIITEATQQNGAELTAMLMLKYNIPISNVIRHFDVSFKNCPQQFVRHPEAWNAFKLKVLGYVIQQKYDLSAGTVAYLMAYQYAFALLEGLLIGKKDFSAETTKYLYAYKFWNSLRAKLGL